MTLTVFWDSSHHGLVLFLSKLLYICHLNFCTYLPTCGISTSPVVSLTWPPLSCWTEVPSYKSNTFRVLLSDSFRLHYSRHFKEANFLLERSWLMFHCQNWLHYLTYSCLHLKLRNNKSWNISIANIWNAREPDLQIDCIVTITRGGLSSKILWLMKPEIKHFAPNFSIEG